MNIAAYILSVLVPTLGGVISTIILNWRSQNDPRRKIIEGLRYLSKDIDQFYLSFSARGINAWIFTILLVIGSFLSLLFKSALYFSPSILLIFSLIVILIQFQPKKFKGQEFVEDFEYKDLLNFWYFTRKFRVPILLTIYLNLYVETLLAFYILRSPLIFYGIAFEPRSWNVQTVLISGLVPVLFLCSIHLIIYNLKNTKKSINLYYQNLPEIKRSVIRRPDGTLRTIRNVKKMNRSVDELADIEDLVFRLSNLQVWMAIWDGHGIVSGRILSIGRYLIIESQYSVMSIPWERIERLEIPNTSKYDVSKELS